MQTGAGRTSFDDDNSRPKNLRDTTLALQHINQLLDEQSQRIAHAVHNEAGQLLAAVFVRLEEAARDLPPGSEACLENIKRTLELIEAQLSELAHELRPAALDDLGLVRAIDAMAERLSRRYEITIVREGDAPGIPEPIETAIYRIVQESLNNVVKHAKATRATVKLTRAEGQIECRIQDNGTGFDVAEVLARKGARGLGLTGIREQVDSVGGSLAISSLPGNGATFCITIPWGE